MVLLLLELHRLRAYLYKSTYRKESTMSTKNKLWTDNRVFNQVVWLVSLIEQRGENPFSNTIDDKYLGEYKTQLQEAITSSGEYIRQCVEQAVSAHHIGMNTVTALCDIVVFQQGFLNGRPLGVSYYIQRNFDNDTFSVVDIKNPKYLHGYADAYTAAINMAKRFINDNCYKQVKESNNVN